MSETPRTDALAKEPAQSQVLREVRMTNHARQLETALRLACARLDEKADGRPDADWYVDRFMSEAKEELK